MVTTPPQKHRRPLALSLVVWILLLGALTNIALGVANLYLHDMFTRDYSSIIIFAQDDPDLLTDDGSLIVDGVYYIVAGVVQLVIAVGAWREKRWAWVSAMTWQAVKLLVELTFTFGVEGNAISMVFSILLIFMLNQSDVRRVFAIQRSENESSPAKPLTALDVN